MAADWFDDWGNERAIAVLDTWPGAVRRPAIKGPRMGDHLKNSASYALAGELPREITVDRRGKTRGVKVYVNLVAVDGTGSMQVSFPKSMSWSDDQPVPRAKMETPASARA